MNETDVLRKQLELAEQKRDEHWAELQKLQFNYKECFDQLKAVREERNKIYIQLNAENDALKECIRIIIQEMK